MGLLHEFIAFVFHVKVSINDLRVPSFQLKPLHVLGGAVKTTPEAANLGSRMDFAKTKVCMSNMSKVGRQAVLPLNYLTLLSL